MTFYFQLLEFLVITIGGCYVIVWVLEHKKSSGLMRTLIALILMLLVTVVSCMILLNQVIQ